MNLVMKGRLRVPLIWLSLPVLAFTVFAACGDGGDDSGGRTTSPAASSPTTQSGPGAITITSSPIVGQADKMLIISAAPQGPTFGPVAQACVPITSDNFTVPATVLTETTAGQAPCGDSTPAARLSERTYALTAGIYVPPAQTAEVEISKTVRVSGDVTAQIDGAALSR